MSDLDDFGAEFYFGDAQVIADAAKSWRWRDLRVGDAVDAFVGFPTCVHSLDVLHLPQAIAGASGRPTVPLGESLDELAGDEGLWAAQVIPAAWLNSVATIPDDLVDSVCERWARAIESEYGHIWDLPPVAAAFRRLLLCARRPLGPGQSAVIIWKQ